MDETQKKSGERKKRGEMVGCEKEEASGRGKAKRKGDRKWKPEAHVNIRPEEFCLCHCYLYFISSAAPKRTSCRTLDPSPAVLPTVHMYLYIRPSAPPPPERGEDFGGY